jgi:RNA 2',3'-cyclic 3'-phosphodiesterase
MFNRLTSETGVRTHWTLRAKGKPTAFVELLRAVDDAVAAEGLPRGPGHQPHITVSYRAPTALDTLPINPPIPWLIEELLLVRGGVYDGVYQYEVDSRWPLRPSPQLSLF